MDILIIATLLLSTFQISLSSYAYGEIVVVDGFAVPRDWKIEVFDSGMRKLAEGRGAVVVGYGSYHVCIYVEDVGYLTPIQFCDEIDVVGRVVIRVPTGILQLRGGPADVSIRRGGDLVWGKRVIDVVDVTLLSGTYEVVVVGVGSKYVEVRPGKVVTVDIPSAISTRTDGANKGPDGTNRNSGEEKISPAISSDKDRKQVGESHGGNVMSWLLIAVVSSVVAVVVFLYLRSRGMNEPTKKVVRLPARAVYKLITSDSFRESQRVW